MSDSRSSLIGKVTTPLGFFVLAVLIVEAGLFGSLKFLPSDTHPFVLSGAFAILILLILLVAGIAIWRPEALHGHNRVSNSFAETIGVDIYSVFDMYISNLESAHEQREAYEMLVLVIRGQDGADQAALRAQISAVIAKRLEIIKKITVRAPTDPTPAAAKGT